MFAYLLDVNHLVGGVPAGKLAQFGRSVIEDVSRKLVRQTAECISANLQAAPTG